MINSVIFGIFFIVSVYSDAVDSDASCITECSETIMPRCGTWLTREDNAKVGGTYELNKGVLNMSCEFSSLPKPAEVIWMHKGGNTNSWSTFPCSTKLENKVCGSSGHTVESRCILRTTNLNMSGSYRCQAATTSFATENSKAYGSAFEVDVVGISDVIVHNHTLIYNKFGNILVEICANPKPEVFWLSKNHIITPHEGNHRLTATHLHRRRIRLDAVGPSTIVPYCYISELFIRKVELDDSFQLLIKSDDITQTYNFGLRVKSSMSSFSNFIGIIIMTILLLK